MYEYKFDIFLPKRYRAIYIYMHSLVLSLTALNLQIESFMLANSKCRIKFFMNRTKFNYITLVKQKFISNMSDF